MKKALIVLICLSMAMVGLTSCQQQGYTADVFLFDESDPITAQLEEAVQDQLGKIGDLTVYYHDAENSIDKQLEQIDEVIKRKTSLLIVHLVQTDDNVEAYDVIAKAKDANLPVLFIERQPDSSAVASYKGSSLFIGYSIDSAATLFGEMVGQYILDHFQEMDLNRDGKISYAMLRGQLGLTVSSRRTLMPITKINEMLTEQDRSELSFYDSENTLSYLSSEGKRDLAKRFIQDALAAFPFDADSPIELVMSNTDDMALGAIEALQEIGYNTGEQDAPFIPVFGIDGTEQGVAAVERGVLTGTVRWDVPRIAAELATVVRILMGGGSLSDYLTPLSEQTEAAEDTEAIVRLDTDIDLVFLPYEKIMQPGAEDEAEEALYRAA